MLKYGQARHYPIGHRDSWRKIAITLIDLGPGLAGLGHSLPKLLWVVLHLLTAEQEKHDSERDDRYRPEGRRMQYVSLSACDGD